MRPAGTLYLLDFLGACKEAYSSSTRKWSCSRAWQPLLWYVHPPTLDVDNMLYNARAMPAAMLACSSVMSSTIKPVT